MKAGWKDLGHGLFQRNLGIILLSAYWEVTGPKDNAISGWRASAGRMRHKKLLDDSEDAMKTAESMAIKWMKRVLESLAGEGD